MANDTWGEINTKPVLLVWNHFVYQASKSPNQVEIAEQNTEHRVSTKNICNGKEGKQNSVETNNATVWSRVNDINEWLNCMTMTIGYQNKWLTLSAVKGGFSICHFGIFKPIGGQH